MDRNHNCDFSCNMNDVDSCDFEIFCPDVPLAVSKEDLMQAFEHFGEVSSAKIIKKRRGKGWYGIIRFETKEGRERAVEYDTVSIKGSNITRMRRNPCRSFWSRRGQHNDFSDICDNNNTYYEREYQLQDRYQSSQQYETARSNYNYSVEQGIDHEKDYQRSHSVELIKTFV